MAEQEKRAPAEGWLDKATAGIRFGPDRREVRRELEEHLEDKALDYLRIFPDLTKEEARQRAPPVIRAPGAGGPLWGRARGGRGLGGGGKFLVGRRGPPAPPLDAR